MSDIWSSTLHVASFGGVDFDCLLTRDSMCRAVARHSIPGRDGGRLQDLGADPRETRARLIFWERAPVEGESDISAMDHLRRFQLFVEAVQKGEPQEFIHPITGSYRALVDDFDWDADGEERDVLLADVTFIEDAYDPPALDLGAGRPLASGVAAVQLETEELTAQLDALGIESSLGTDALTTVSAWESAGTSVRKVNLQLQSLSAQIAEAVDAYELATNLSRHYLWRSVQRLHQQIRRAAEAFRQTQPNLVATTVAAPIPLRVLTADLYGARDAQDRYDEALKLNDIDDPGLIPAGAVLQLPAPSTRGQQSLRGAA